MKSKDQKMGKKLRDYPSVPGTPPLSTQSPDKGLTCLETELNREKLYLALLQRENREIEKILHDLDHELEYVKNNFPHPSDGKTRSDHAYWFKYEAQLEVNRKLERERKHLENEVKQMEEQGMINLDALTQSELILYVKQLERTKTDLLSELRAKEWSLDKQAKDFHHLSETKRELEAEIRHYDGEHAMYRHYKRTACPSASVSVSRQSSQKNSARKTRPGPGKNLQSSLKKGSSVSQENIATTSASRAKDVMFRSLDETNLEELEDVQDRRFREPLTDRKKVAESKRGGIKTGSSVGSLPELSKQRNKTPMGTSKTVRSQREHNKSKARPDTGSTSSSIRIIVTDESNRTRTEVEEVELGKESCGTSGSGNESGIGSPSDGYYQDDFEESDTDTRPEIRACSGRPRWRV